MPIMCIHWTSRKCWSKAKPAGSSQNKLEQADPFLNTTRPLPDWLWTYGHNTISFVTTKESPTSPGMPEFLTKYNSSLRQIPGVDLHLDNSNPPKLLAMNPPVISNCNVYGGWTQIMYMYMKTFRYWPSRKMHNFIELLIHNDSTLVKEPSMGLNRSCLSFHLHSWCWKLDFVIEEMNDFWLNSEFKLASNIKWGHLNDCRFLFSSVNTKFYF